MTNEVIVKSFPSTVSGGTTIVLESVAQATDAGRSYSLKEISKYADLPKGTKINAYKIRTNRHRQSSKPPATRPVNAEKMAKDWRARLDCFNTVARRIQCGDPYTRKAINEMAERLVEDVLELRPNIAQKFDGFERSEDGFTASPDLVAMGDDRPCFRRRRGGEPKPGAGDGAYRVIINTDVPWWGNAGDNAAVMGALVILLQRYGPVEVWIQQGWMRGGNESNGVTLFKLDFTGGFEPTQLAFWCGDPNKDNVYSHDVNKGLGRVDTAVSVEAEIPCDLYLHGAWMRLHGVNSAGAWNLMSVAEQRKAMAEWLANMVQEITYPNEASEVT